MNKYDNITIFSPIRTGSTLLYNITKKIFNDKTIIKSHNINYQLDNMYFITMRHPYNSILSNMLSRNKEINNVNINNAINEYLDNGGNDMINLDIQSKNIIIFRYEHFKDNFKYIFDILKNNLNITINDELKNNINDELNIYNIINYTKKYKSFDEYCKITHWHGNHISLNKGDTNYKKYFSNENIKILENNKNINEILNKYNY